MPKAKLATTALLPLLLASGCNEHGTILERVKDDGVLVAVTRNSATTYYEGPDGKPTGLEYELLKRFAANLGVELKVIVPKNFAEILPMVAAGNAHLAAAGVPASDSAGDLVRFGPRYQSSSQQLIYRIGRTPPSALADLVDADSLLVTSSRHAEQLRRLASDNPGLRWAEADMDSEELLTLVSEGMVDYTIADSNGFAVNRRFFPELRPAFDLAPPQRLAWAFPKDSDDSLYNAAVAFFSRIMDNGELDQLIERFYGHTRRFDYVSTRTFIQHVAERLPRYRELFEKAGAEAGVDWRLLAAMGYQESGWKPTAVSPAGARGLMMFMQGTADMMRIDPNDPAQSILGGGRYLRDLRERIPADIPEPDRTWMAVAAYNVGIGHLEDARVITERRGRDPDKWVHVKDSLPLLRRQEWFSKARHGYARGHEPVYYVENVRNYYDQLVWITEPKLVRNDPRQQLKLAQARGLAQLSAVP